MQIDPILVSKRALANLRQRLFVLRHERELPFLGRFDRHIIETKRELRVAYDEYVSTVSTRRMAVSFELSCLLDFLCWELKPDVIVDLGSGFSSYIFRMYKRERGSPVTVYSVDDSSEWLEKTADLLLSNNLSVDNLVDWSTFRRLEPVVQADLILHDLSVPAIRVGTFPDIHKFAHSGTLTVLDDMHKGLLRRGAQQFVQRNRLRYQDLEHRTVDQFGRFQWCVFSSDSPYANAAPQ